MTSESSEGGKPEALLRVRFCLACMAALGAACSVSSVLQRAGPEDSGWRVVRGEPRLHVVCGRARAFILRCPRGWADVRSADSHRCFRLARAAGRWEDAAARCRDVGGEVASIPDRASDAAVREVCGARRRCWIGATASSSGWRWSDNRTEWTWEGWAHGEPSSNATSEARVAVSVRQPQESTLIPMAQVVVDALVAVLACGTLIPMAQVVLVAPLIDSACVALSALGLAAGISQLLHALQLVVSVGVALRLAVLGGFACLRVRTALLRRGAGPGCAPPAADEPSTIGACEVVIDVAGPAPLEAPVGAKHEMARTE